MTRLPDRPSTIDEALTLGRRPLVIGHRGASGLAPQNTLPAFEHAIELGVDMVELDVQLSRDHELVVIHDADLDATTDGRGPVAARTLEELKRLDAGSWLRRRWAGTRIPTLREVLELTGSRALVNVEIKTEAVTDESEGGVERRVADLVRELGLAERVIVSSFDPRALVHLRELAPEIATASLYNEELHHDLSPIEVMDAVGSRAFNLSKRQVDRAIVELCHAHGRPVSVYTVNRKREMRLLLEVGVDAMFTDRPDRLLDTLANASPLRVPWA